MHHCTWNSKRSESDFFINTCRKIYLFYLATPKEIWSALSSSSRDIEASFPLEPISSSATSRVVSLDEAVSITSSAPWRRSGVWPVPIGDEQSLTMLLPMRLVVDVIRNDVNRVLENEFLPLNRSGWYTYTSICSVLHAIKTFAERLDDSHKTPRVCVGNSGMRNKISLTCI